MDEKIAGCEYLTSEHKKYLDALRRSGIVNMFGARPYLQEAFPELDRNEASKVLGEWMKTFKEEDR